MTWLKLLEKKQQKNLGEFSPNTFSFEIGLFSTRMILLKKKQKHGIVKKAEELGV